MKVKYVYLIIVGIIINMCLGAVYSWSIFRKPLEEILGISSTVSGLPYMFFLVAYAFSMPFAGRLIEKYGPRRIAIIGGIVVALGWILTSFAANIYMVILSYGLMAGAGVGVVYGAPLAVSANWFPRRKGLAVGLTLSGFGLSPFVTAPLSIYLIEQFGVMSTFRVMGLLFLTVIVLLAIPLRMPPKNIEGAANQNAPKIKEFEYSLREVIRDGRFKILWVCFMIGTFVGLMAIGISSPVAQEMIGISPHESAFFVALFAVFNGIGRPLFGFLTDKLHFKKIALVNFGIIISASALILNAGEGTITLYALSFVLFWFILGGWLAIAPATVAALFGVKNYARNYGVLFTAYGIGAIFANLASGILRDLLGSYIYVFYATIAAAAAGIVIVLIFGGRGTDFEKHEISKV